MNYFLAIIFILFSATSFADDKEPPYTQGQFLSKIQSGQASLKSSPLFPAGETFINGVYEMHKKNIPSFRRELLYYHYYSEGVWLYTIAWDWVNYRCVFGIDKRNTDKNSKEIFDRKEFKKRYPSDKPSEMGETINKSICEKLYGFPL